MGLLTTPALEELLEKGCCRGAKLEFESYVDGKFALLEGEQYGAVIWAYKGETFVDGVFEITCTGCKKTLFTADVCPRCHAPGALAGILETPNRLELARACPKCQSPKLNLVAMLPARVLYEGKRADKARANVDMADDGFHGYRVECVACGVVAAVRDTCPLCTAPGPLRARPH